MKLTDLNRRLTAAGALAVLVLGLAPAALAGEASNYAEALQQAKTSGQMVVLDFFTDW